MPRDLGPACAGRSLRNPECLIVTVSLLPVPESEQTGERQPCHSVLAVGSKGGSLLAQ